MSAFPRVSRGFCYTSTFTKHTYARTHQMASIKEEVPDTDEFMRFKAACGELSRGALSCDDYFTTQNATLRKLARSDIGSECPVSLYLAVSFCEEVFV